MPSAARRAARAVQAAGRRGVARNAMSVEMAVITSAHPLTVQLVKGGLLLGEDILLLSSAFRRHDRDFGAKVGDTVGIVRQASGEYLVLDVQTSGEIMRGISTQAQDGSTLTLEVMGGTGGSVALEVAKWLEAFDEDGSSIGFVPVLASKGTHVTALPASRSPGGLVTIAWDGVVVPTTSDWVAMVHYGDPAPSYIDWFYAGSGTQVLGAAEASTGSHPSYAMPMTPGSYQFFLLHAGTYSTLAISNVVVVA